MPLFGKARLGYEITAQDKSGPALQSSKRGIESLNKPLAEISRNTAQTERATSSLAKSIDNLGSNATREFNGVSDGVANVAGTIAGAAVKFLAFRSIAGAALGAVGNAVVGLAGLFATLKLSEGFIETAETMKRTEAQLKLVTGTGKEFFAVQEAIYQSSQALGQPLVQSINLYNSLGRVLKQSGVDYQRVLQLTESVGLALKAGSTDSISAAHALRQLAQALGAGALRGDEFVSMMENFPRGAQAIADGMGVPIGKLRELSKEGVLTTEAIMKAMISQQGKLRAEAEKIPLTIGQATTKLHTNFQLYIQDIDKATGITSTLAGAVDLVASAFSRGENKLGPLIARVREATAEFETFKVQLTGVGSALGSDWDKNIHGGLSRIGGALSGLSEKFTLFRELMGSIASPAGIVTRMVELARGSPADIERERVARASRGNAVPGASSAPRFGSMQDDSVLRQAQNKLEAEFKAAASGGGGASSGGGGRSGSSEDSIRKRAAAEIQAINEKSERRRKDAIEEEEEEEEALRNRLEAINDERNARKESLQDRISNLKGELATEIELENKRHQEALSLVKEAQASEHAIVLGGAKEIADLKARIEQDHQERVLEIQDSANEARREKEEETARVLAEVQEENARLMQQPFLNAIDGIQGSFTDAFEDIFSGGVNSFGELAQTVKKIFIRLAAEMASLFLFQNLFGGIGGIGSMLGLGGIAGAAGGMGGIGGASGALNLAGGASSASQLAGGPGLFSGLTGSINNFGTSLGFSQGAGFVGPPLPGTWTGASLSSTLGAAGLSALGGGLISGAMGGNSMAGSLAGGALGAGGYALGATYGASFGPIGAAIGAILGGLLGGLIKKATPRGDITREIGGGNVREFGKGGFDPTSLNTLADSVEKATQETAKLLGITVTGARFGIGFDQKKGFNVNVADRGGRRDVGFGLEDEAGVTRAIVLDVLNQQARTRFQQVSVGKAYQQSTLEGVLKSIAEDLKFKKEFETFKGTTGVFEHGKKLRDITKTLAAEFHQLIAKAKDLGLNIGGVARTIRKRIREQHVGRAVDIAGQLSGLQEQTGFTGLQAFQRSLKTSDVLAPHDRLSAAREEFNRLQRRAGRGDLSAARELPTAGQNLLGIARETHGSGPQFAEIFKQVNVAINSMIEAQKRQFKFQDLDLTMRDLAREQAASIKHQTKELTGELRAVVREIRRLGGLRAA